MWSISNKIGGRWRKEQYTVTVSRNARLLIMVLGENHHDMMTTTIFRRERIRQQVSLATHSWLGLLHSTFHVDIWPPSPLKEDASEG